MTEPTQQTIRHILELPKETSSLWKDWMPVIQSAIWPLLLLVVLIVYRRHLLSILYSLAERVRQGDPWKIGPVEMGAAKRKLEGAEHPRELVTADEGAVLTG